MSKTMTIVRRIANFERTFGVKLKPGEYCQVEIKEGK